MLILLRQQQLRLLFKSRGTCIVLLGSLVSGPGHSNIRILIISHWGIKSEWSSELLPLEEVILGCLEARSSCSHRRASLFNTERSLSFLWCDISLLGYRWYFPKVVQKQWFHMHFLFSQEVFVQELLEKKLATQQKDSLLTFHWEMKFGPRYATLSTSLEGCTPRQRSECLWYQEISASSEASDWHVPRPLLTRQSGQG